MEIIAFPLSKGNSPGSFIGHDLSVKQVDEIIDMVEAGIYLAAWLTFVVRDEIKQFNNFVRWIRFGELSQATG